MSLKIVFILLALAGLFGVAFGYFLRWIISLGKRGSMELEIRQMRMDAEEKSKHIIEEAVQKATEKGEKLLGEYKGRERELKTTEERLVRKEELETAKQKSEELIRTQQDKLEKVAGLSSDEAKKELIASIEKQYENDIEGRMRKLEIAGNERLEQRAKEILTTAVHRLGNSVVSDVLATTISLPSDEIKGKIIGKEGRNIRAFERATGVDVIVDDTPGTITLSSYDPMRRQIARIAF